MRQSTLAVASIVRSKSTVLVTGATDGIGLELAQLYRQQGRRLVLIGWRPVDELDPALFTPESYCRVDLARSDCGSAVAGYLERQGIDGIDLLIHCAGVGYYGTVAGQSHESMEELVAVNLRAPIVLTHALMPHLHGTRGTVVFVSSVASALPCPHYAVYGATKAALDGFARSLRVELRGMVKVQVIHPGATRTAMHAKSGASLADLGWERFPSPKLVAAAMARVITGGKSSATIGWGNRLLWWSGRLLPTLVDSVMRRRFQ